MDTDELEPKYLYLAYAGPLQKEVAEAEIATSLGKTGVIGFTRGQLRAGRKARLIHYTETRHLEPYLAFKDNQFPLKEAIHFTEGNQPWAHGALILNVTPTRALALMLEITPVMAAAGPWKSREAGR